MNKYPHATFYDPERRTPWKLTAPDGFVYGSDNPQGTFNATEVEARAHAARYIELAGVLTITNVRYDVIITVEA